MGKTPKKLVNFRLSLEHVAIIQEMAISLGLSQAEVVGKAVEVLAVAKSFGVESLRLPEEPEKAEPLYDPALVPGVQVGPKSKCDHCGQMRAPRRMPLCTVCANAGHSGEPRNCGECTAGVAA